MDDAVYSSDGGATWWELRYPDGHPREFESLDLAFVLTSCQCYTGPTAEYAEWLSVGEPPEWCWLRQCHGDADNALEWWGRFGTQYRAHVGYNDLDVLLDAWRNDADPNFSWAGDVDHAAEWWGRFGTQYNARIGYDDLDVVLYWWRKTSDQDNNPPGDCNTPDPADGFKTDH
jgi:hypothetical protein